MHHWDIVHERAVAPSPIVPTYRPDPPSKRRNSSMPSTVSGSPDSIRSRGGSGPRPQARSAGMAERPSRNESLSDLVRFFQTQNMPPASSAPPPVGSPESTTALPVMVSPEPKELGTELTKEQLKPLHRRLLQFTQRPKKESSPRSKSDDNQKQIEALQREGYLMSSSKPKSTSDRSKSSSKTSLDRSTKTSLDRPKSSLERTFSRSKKQDVEAIGRPWLSRSDSNRSSNDPKRRLASLELDDFGSMLDVTVSLSEFDDLSPPPYQPSTVNAPASRNTVNPSSAASSSVAESALPMPRPSSEACLRPSDRLMTPSISTLETQGSGVTDDLPQPSSSTNSSIGVSDRDHKASSILSIDPSPSVAASDQSLRSEPSQCQTIEQPQAPARPPPNPPGSTSSTPTHSLKLFPDVAPPRISSKNAWRLSSAPRYQTTTTTKTAPPLKTELQTEAQKENSPPEAQLQPVEAPAVSAKKAEEQASSAASGTAITSDPVTAEAKKRHTALIQGQRKPRPPSLAMGTLQAFPLPAPTRPLPSIPKSNTLAPPVDPRTPSGVRATRSVSKMSSIQHPQPSPIAEEPREPEPRPATALGQTGTGQHEDDDAMSLQTTPERPKSTTPEQYTPRRRSLSVGVPRMRPFPESPIRIDDSSTDDQPLADSPVLGQMFSQTSHGKRATRKDLQINTRTERKHLPFGLPSPPPSAALPLDPPAQKSVDRSSHRNYTAPVHAGVHQQKSLESSFGSSNHRASLVSRSNSSRSSLRHESIPESSYEEHGRAESPLPSSDDEGFGPNAAATKHAYLVEDKQKQKQRTHQLRRGYETVDGRTSHGRPRYTHPRPSTPQGHRSHGFDKSLSPQSHYSQSTMRSRDSQSGHRYRAPAQDANNLLEDRIANLERQNQVLQAALMAALNAGIKPNIDLHESAIPPSFSTAGLGNPYQGYQGRHAMRPDSWMSSSRSSELSGFETPGSVRDARANARQLDNMLEDIETGWMSDKSSVGTRSMARHR